MLEQSSVEIENTITNLEEKNNNVDDEGTVIYVTVTAVCTSK